MTRMVQCVVLKEQAEGLDAPPHPGQIGERIYDQTLRHVTDEATRLAVYDQARRKYPDWTAPAPENVHVMQVES